MTTSYITRALNAARKNLDMSHAARMKRARELGFDTDRVWKHGTNQDITEFSHRFGGDVTSGHPASQGTTWLAEDPAHASQYAEMAGKHTRANKVEIERLRPDIERKLAAAEKRGDWDEWERLTEFWEDLELGDATKGGENVMPLMARTQNTYIFDPQKSELNLLEALEKAKSEGYDSFLWKGSTDTPYGNVDAGDHLAVFDPSNIRSINAAFDPEKSGSSNILAGLGAAGIGTAALMGSEDAEAAPLGTLAKQIGKKTRKAHHGSPHDFDKFSLSKIGTGEGAQAYGHGLYFSSSEDIARYYRDAISKEKARMVRPDGVGIGTDEAERLIAREIVERAESTGGYVNPDRARDIARQVVEGKRVGDSFDDMRRFVQKSDWDATEKRDWMNALDAGDQYTVSEPKGKLYTVEIPDESLMLDWDKPLSEQPEGVREALKEYAGQAGGYQIVPKGDGFSVEFNGIPGPFYRSEADARRYVEGLGENLIKPDEMTGEELLIRLRHKYREAGARNPEAMASEELRALGIPGITYKGGSSGERNFVVFDDELINLVEKGQIDPKMLPYLAAAGGAGAYGVSQMQDTDPAMDTFNASEEDLRAAQERFKQMRQGKGWSGLKDAIATLGSAIGGGIIADASRLGGYLNPFISVEDTEAGARAIENALQYVPEAPNQYLEGLGRGMDQFMQDIEPITGGWEESIPGKAYEALPERVQGLLRVGSDLLL